MGLAELVEVSRRYGGDGDYVLAGGGNTSFKDERLLYIKASGTTLAELTEEGLVRMDRSRLGAIWRRHYPEDAAEREREALADLMASRAQGETKRPSVETLLHDLLRQQYVVHLHPTLVNGLTCGRDGEEIAREIFPRGMLWIPVVNPGYVLAGRMRDAVEAHLAAGREYPSVLFLQNHGVFVAADAIEEIDRIYGDIMERIRGRLKRVPDLSPKESERNTELTEVAGLIARAIERRGLLGKIESEILSNPEIDRTVASPTAFAALRSFGYTPDHLVYCRAAPVWIPSRSAADGRFVDTEIARFLKTYGSAPRVFAVEGAGIVVAGESRSVAKNAAALFLDLLRLVAYAESSGGPNLMPKDKIDFILNWEAESYRAEVGQGAK